MIRAHSVEDCMVYLSLPEKMRSADACQDTGRRTNDFDDLHHFKPSSAKFARYRGSNQPGLGIPSQGVTFFTMSLFAPFAAPSPRAPTGSACWICLEADGESNEPLLRNCACRGSSGWAHVSCLAEHARRAAAKGEKGKTSTSAAKAWAICSQCNQQYQGDVGVALAEKWVESTEGDNQGSSIATKDYEPPRLDALQHLAFLRCDVGDFDGSIKLHEHLLKVLQIPLDKLTRASNSTKSSVQRGKILRSIEERIADENKCLALAYVQKIMAHPSHQNPFLHKIPFQRARDCLISAHQTYTRHDSPSAMETAQMLRDFDVDPQVGLDTAAKVTRARKAYEQSLEKDNVVVTINYARSYVQALADDGQFSKADDVLQETIVLSTRVLGPDNAETVHLIEDVRGDIKAAAKEGCGNKKKKRGGKATTSSSAGGFSSTGSTMPGLAMLTTMYNAVDDGSLIVAMICNHPTQPSLNGKVVHVLRRTKQGDKFIVGFPPGSSRSGKFKAAPEHLEFVNGTGIVVQDLQSAVHLNGQSGRIESFDKKNGRYVVTIWDGSDKGFRGGLKRDNIEIVLS